MIFFGFHLLDWVLVTLAIIDCSRYAFPFILSWIGIFRVFLGIVSLTIIEYPVHRTIPHGLFHLINIVLHLGRMEYALGEVDVNKLALG